MLILITCDLGPKVWLKVATLTEMCSNKSKWKCKQLLMFSVARSWKYYLN